MKIICTSPLLSLPLFTLSFLSPLAAFSQEEVEAASPSASAESPSAEADASESAPAEAPTESAASEEAPKEEAPSEAVAEYPPVEPVEEKEEAAVVVAPVAAAAVAPVVEPEPQGEALVAEKAGDPLAAAEQAEADSDQKEKEERDFWAIYLAGNLVGTFGLDASHQWKEDCPSVPEIAWSPDCKIMKPIGVALDGRLGVRLAFIGLEGFLLLAADWSSAKLDGGGDLPIDLPDIARGMQVARVGGALGGGIRLMTLPAKAQISGGFGGGVAMRRVFTSASSLDGSSEGYVAPMMRADITLTFFKKLNLGVMGWVEFPKDVVVSPEVPPIAGLPADQIQPLLDLLGDVTVFQGPQFFIGPFLGLTFGG